MKHNKTFLMMTAVLAVILAIAGYTYNSTQVVTEKLVETHQQSIVGEAAKTVELWLSQNLRIIEATASTVEQIPIAATPETLRPLKMAMKAGNFSDVYIGLKDGTMIDGADWVPPPGYDPRVRPWYRKAVAENRVAFTTPYVDMTTNKLVIAVVKPLVVNERFVGVISADIILDTLEQNVMNIRIGQSGYPFIIDHQGTLLVHPDHSLLMTTRIQDGDPSLRDSLAIFKTMGAGSFYYSYQGREKMLSFQKLTHSDWYLCTTILKDEAHTLAKKTAMLFAMGTIFKILGVLVTLLFLVAGGSVLILVISKQRLEAIVKEHKEILSGKDKDLKGEITRRKEIETRYQTLFNVATNGIMLGRGLTFIECNEKADAMFGYERGQILGKSLLDLSSDIQQDGRASSARYRQILDHLESGEQIVFEWAFRRADGSEFPAEVGLKALQLDSETVSLYSIWDISRRVNAEHELRQAQKMAAMGEMLSVIAHQWRQPLNALSTYIASLPGAYYNNLITREFIDRLVREADSQIQFMSLTINDFRQYFRPSHTKQIFLVQDAVDSAVKLIRPQLKQNAITLEIHDLLEADAGYVFGYRNEFVHVLVNVISNAKDAILEKEMKTGHKEFQRQIDLSMRIEERSLIMEIVDTGCGIPEPLLNKIFTPYFTTKGTATGTGIGLYMAKQIVEKEMHGRIWVQILLDGAQFTIQLPLSDLKGRPNA